VAARFYHYVNDELDLRSISDNSIYAIFSATGTTTIWVGTNSRAAYVFTMANRKPFVIYQKNLKPINPIWPTIKSRLS